MYDARFPYIGSSRYHSHLTSKVPTDLECQGSKGSKGWDHMKEKRDIYHC